MSTGLTGRPSRRAGALAALVAGLILPALAAVPARAPAATLPTLTLTLNASSISVSGSTQSGGVNVVSIANGVKEASAILIRLNPGVKPAEVIAFLATKASQEPNNVAKYGSIVYDAEAAPGPGREAQIDLQPAEYVAFAAVGEKPPTAHTSFTVTASHAAAVLPPPAATVRAREFGFTGPRTLKDGELVRFENEGFVVHMDLAFPTRSRKAARKLAKAFLTGKGEKKAFKLVSGQPVDFHGPLSTGAFQQEVITAKPGWYVQVCFMDTQDRREHTLLGMERIIKITR
jgi:hypothetical protein